MAAKDDKAIEAEYREKRPLYERLCREVVVNLEELVKVLHHAEDSSILS